MLEQFTCEKRVDADFVERFRGRVPEELMEYWILLGFGTVYKGFLKLINPEEYIDIVKKIYPKANKEESSGEIIPFIITALGDIICCENKSTIKLINPYTGQDTILYVGFKYFFDALLDEYFFNRFLNIKLYKELINKFEEPGYTYCFMQNNISHEYSKIPIKDFFLMLAERNNIIY